VKVGDIVAIEWTDAVLRSDGDHNNAYPPVKVITYGKLIVKSKGHVTVAHEEFIDEDTAGDLRQVTTIPRGMVSNVTTLRGAHDG
jgi:hypothetical protein